MKKRVLAAGLVGLLAATAAYNADRAYLVPHGVDRAKAVTSQIIGGVQQSYTSLLHDNEHRRPPVYTPF